MADSAETKRQAARVPVSFDITFRSEDYSAKGVTQNISMGGAFVATPYPMPLGQTIELELHLPDGAVSAVGVPRWARMSTERSLRPSGMGVQFTDVISEHQDILNEFIVHSMDLMEDNIHSI